MHLRQRGGRHGPFLEVIERLGDAHAELLRHDPLHLGVGKGLHVVLQAGEGVERGLGRMSGRVERS
jgi:hypothetical protein